MLEYKNEWRSLSNEIGTGQFDFLGYDLRVKSTGKIYQKWNYSWDLDSADGILVEVVFYPYPDERDPEYTYVPASDVEVRVHDKALKTLLKNFNSIKVGSFVRTNSGMKYWSKPAWRKVISIDEKNFTFFGQCAWEPNDESLIERTSSNGIITIKEFA